MDDRFVIWSFTYEAWRGTGGYTVYLAMAERYAQEEADAVVDAVNQTALHEVVIRERVAARFSDDELRWWEEPSP